MIYGNLKFLKDLYHFMLITSYSFKQLLRNFDNRSKVYVNHNLEMLQNWTDKSYRSTGISVQEEFQCEYQSFLVFPYTIETRENMFVLNVQCLLFNAIFY